MPDPISAESLAYVTRRILETFPELQARYEEEVAFWEDEPVPLYFMVEMVFLPLLREQMSGSEQAGLAKSFALLEEFEAHPDFEIRNAVGVGVIEGWSEEEQSIALQHMGPLTRADYQGQRDWWLEHRQAEGKE